MCVLIFVHVCVCTCVHVHIWAAVHIVGSLVLPDYRTSFHLYRESGHSPLTNINSLEGACLVETKLLDLPSATLDLP